MATGRLSSLGSSLCARVALGSVVATVLTVAACSTERTPQPPAGMERTETSVQELQAASFFGTSLAAKTLALTFDDGPGARAAELSMYLKAQGIKAAFFVNGNRITTSASLPNTTGIAVTPNAAAILTQLVADGHLVANHTVTHRDVVTEVLPTGAANVILELSETDADIAGFVPSGRFLFRAPYGSWNAAAYNALRLDPMNKYVGPINWETGGVSNGYPNAAADWACWQGQLYAGAAKANGTGYATLTQCGDAYVREIDSVGKGIVLMHDPYFRAGSPGDSTVDMVKYIVPILKAKGYSFVRVDEVPAIAAALPPPACHPSCATCSGPGANQCTGCNAGRYLNGSTCNACGVCAADRYQVSACAASANTVCGACDVSCATCNSAGPAACASCKANTYLDGNSCTACSVCAPGTFLIAACGPAANAVCGACDASCSVCAGPNPDQCGSCPSNSYLEGGSCRACTVCAAGTALTTACSAAANTICTPCATGSFSGGPGATSCTACAPGTFAASPGSLACTACAAGTHAAAGATSCATCGDCDDRDACTQDACDKTRGCTHTRVPGCAPGDPGTTVDAGGGAHAAPIIPDGEGGGEDGGGGGGGGGGCTTAPGPHQDGLFLVALGAVSMLRWRRRSTRC